MTFSRRAFGMSAMALSISTSATARALARGKRDDRPTIPWYKTVRRIGQTNFTERDPQTGNIEAWADFWAETKAQAVVLSFTSSIAFYPTRVPYLPTSRYLGGKDFVGDCIKAAKDRGLRVIARLTPDNQFIEPKVLAERPLWFRRDKNGKLLTPAEDIALCCQFGGKFDEQQPRILREINARYDIDGVFTNGFPKPQVCYCETCRSIGDPHSDVYRAALLDRVDHLIDLYRGIVLEKNPDNFFSAAIIGGLGEPGLDQWRLSRKAMWYTVDNQARSETTDPVWQIGLRVKYARALMGDRPVTAVTAGYSRAGGTAWRQGSEMTVEPLIRMAQVAATGAVVWNNHIGLTEGFAKDPRWQANTREFFTWQAAHDRHFENVRSLANVAIVVPNRTLEREHPAKEDPLDHLQGIYACLLEARIPVDLVHENELGTARPEQYDLLILPNFALMSDAQAVALEAFVRKGGSLLATFQTGLFDELGKARSDFALASLFGVAKAGEARAESNALAAYAPISLQVPRSDGPAAKWFEGTEWIAGPATMQPIKASADAAMTFIEPYPVFPPEAAYQRTAPGNAPSLVMKELNRARLAYFAGDTDATYWRTTNADLGRQLALTVRWLLRDRVPTTVSGTGLLEVISWATRSGFAVHLLNYESPNAYRGQMREPATLPPQTMTLAVPEDTVIRSVRALRQDKALAFTQSGVVVNVVVPDVGLYELVALEV